MSGADCAGEMKQRIERQPINKLALNLIDAPPDTISVGYFAAGEWLDCDLALAQATPCKGAAFQQGSQS